MFSRDVTLTDIERLERIAGEAVEALQMDEDTFRAFYDRTARLVWAYLARSSGDAALADDLLQETYYRFLRADRAFESESHRRNYLFRIATNLVRDGHRRARNVEFVSVPGEPEPGTRTGGLTAATEAERRADLARAMQRLKPRERELLWLAYANGSSHEEIGASLGLRPASVKVLLFRARRRLAALLRGARPERGRL